MFLDRKNGSKLHKGSVLVGYDLGNRYSQISYCIYGQEDVDTVAIISRQYYVNEKGRTSGIMARTP